MPFDPNTPRSRDEVLLQAIVSGDSTAMGDPRDREEEFVKAIADKETLPDYSEASEGDTLQIGADGPEWAPVNALPDYSGASAGDALVIGNDGPEWGAVPNELPAIAAGDAGKVLKVNSGETGVEWGGSSIELYQHFIEIQIKESSVNMSVPLTIVTSKSTKFSQTELYNFIRNNYNTGDGVAVIYLMSIPVMVGSTLKAVIQIRTSSTANTLRYATVNMSDGTRSSLTDASAANWYIVTETIYKI